MTRTVTDAALLLQVIAGYDAQDPQHRPARSTTWRIEARRLAASWDPTDYFYENLIRHSAGPARRAGVLKKLTRTQRDIAPLAADGTYASVMNPYVAVLNAEAYEYHKDYVAKSRALPGGYAQENPRRADVSISTYMQSVAA